jgi:hypothetical protein
LHALNQYGAILPAEGHLITLLEPEEVNPDWKRWSAVLLRPDGLYGTKPASGGNKLFVAGFQPYQVGRTRALSRVRWITTLMR